MSQGLGTRRKGTKRVLPIRMKSALVATKAPYPQVLGGVVTHTMTVTKADDQFGQPLLKWQLVAMVNGMYVSGDTPWQISVHYEIQFAQRDYDTGEIGWTNVHTFSDHDSALACLEKLHVSFNGEL